MKPTMKFSYIALGALFCQLAHGAATAQITYVTTNTTINSNIDGEVIVGMDADGLTYSNTVTVSEPAIIPGVLLAAGGSTVNISSSDINLVVAIQKGYAVLTDGAVVQYAIAGTTGYTGSHSGGGILVDGGAVTGDLICGNDAAGIIISTTFLQSGAVLGGVIASANGYAKVTGGDAYNSLVAVSGGHADMTGGTVRGIYSEHGSVFLHPHSQINFSGGVDQGDAYVDTDSSLFIHGGTVNGRLINRGGTFLATGGKLDDPSDGWWLYGGETDVYGYGIGITLLNPHYTDPSSPYSWSEYAWHGHLLDGNSLEGKHLFTLNGGGETLNLFSTGASTPEPGPAAILAASGIACGLALRRRRQGVTTVSTEA